MLHVAIRTKLHSFNVDIELDVGNELVVLFGPSGSGKTTILSAIADIHKPDHGLIQLNNKVVFQEGKVNVPTQKRKVGYVFQDYALFPHMTVEKNIYYGVQKKEIDLYKEHVEQLISKLHIQHIRDQSPRNISGGEKQRVALIRALATKPDILLLDEPFAALDETSRYNGYREIDRLKKEWNIPILLVTHNKEEAGMLSDRMIYLNKGKVV